MTGMIIGMYIIALQILFFASPDAFAPAQRNQYHKQSMSVQVQYYKRKKLKSKPCEKLRNKKI